jgi:hypothetical protein
MQPPGLPEPARSLTTTGRPGGQDTIRRRLGWEPGILNGSGLKPKGMHWRTFERLQAEHDAHVAQSLAGIAARLGLLRKLGDDLADRPGGIPGL